MNNFKRLREQANLTQQNIADTLNIRQSTVAMWESGEQFPRADKLPELAKILNCTIDDLFNEGEE